MDDAEPWLSIASDLGIAARAPQHARSPRSCVADLLDLLGSCYIASSTIFTADSMLGCALAVACTAAYWALAPHLAINMSWNIVSLVVIFPISQCIGMGFKRREQALGEFGDMLGNVRSIWGAVHSWKLKDANGQFVRALMSFEQPEVARHQVRALFEEFLTALAAYFAVARWNRARHNAPCCSQDKQEQDELMNSLHISDSDGSDDDGAIESEGYRSRSYPSDWLASCRFLARLWVVRWDGYSNTECGGP